MATLSVLISEVRSLADMVGSTFVTDAEITNWLNLELGALYDALVTKHEDYFLAASPQAITCGGTTGTVALASDCYKVMGVDVQLSNTEWQPVRRFQFAERNQNTGTLSGECSYRYRLMGSNIVLDPIPASGTKFRVWYAPTMTRLASASDAIALGNGWERHAVLGAAAKALMKEESDASGLLAEQARLRVDIEKAMSNRDSGEPARIADTRQLPYFGF